MTNSVGILPKFAQTPGKQYRITLQNLKQNNIKSSEHSLMLLNSKCCSLNTLKYSFERHQLQTDIGQNLYQTQSAKQRALPLTATSPSQRREAQQRTAMSNAVKSQLNDLSAMINEEAPAASSKGKGKAKDKD